MELMLRQERLRRGWTQQYVAEKVGVTKSAILLLENGKTKPSYDVLVKLLDLFNHDDPRKLFGAATPDNAKILTAIRQNRDKPSIHAQTMDVKEK